MLWGTAILLVTKVSWFLDTSRCFLQNTAKEYFQRMLYKSKSMLTIIFVDKSNPIAKSSK